MTPLSATPTRRTVGDPALGLDATFVVGLVDALAALASALLVRERPLRGRSQPRMALE